MSTKKKRKVVEKKSRSRATSARQKVRHKKRQAAARPAARSASFYTIALPPATLRTALRSMRLPAEQHRQALRSIRPFGHGRAIVTDRHWAGSKDQAAALAGRISLLLSYVRGRARSGFAPSMPEVVRVPASNPAGGKVTARRVYLDRGGYDKQGRYFGIGEKLWKIEDPDPDAPPTSRSIYRQRAPSKQAAVLAYLAERNR